MEPRVLLAAGLGEGFIGPVIPDDVPADTTNNLPLVSIADASVIEGDLGVTKLRFDVTLNEAGSQQVSAWIQLTDQSAKRLRADQISAFHRDPNFVTHAPGDPNHIYILYEDGQIQSVRRTIDVSVPPPFMTVPDVSDRVDQGVYGLAFHPDYAVNRKFYVFLTDANDNNVLREYTARAQGLTADPASARTLLVLQKQTRYNSSGWIGFGPDGFLYLATGDDSLVNDEYEHAQDITSDLHGKILRLDVNGDDFPADPDRNYAIPSSNPFVGIDGDDEIWAYGLRNPWRNSFDRETGDFWIADEGQNLTEEINFQPASSSGGENYGWREREGLAATPIVGGPKPEGAIDPVHTYPHDLEFGGRSVTGGYVYRGPIKELWGQYFFADRDSNNVWSFEFDQSSPEEFDGSNHSNLFNWKDVLNIAGADRSIRSFGEDSAGNLYITDRSDDVFMIANGADFVTHTYNRHVTFLPGTTSAVFEIDVIGDRLPESDETMLLSIVNTINATIGDAGAVGTILNDDLPSVASVDIENGSRQRSRIDELTVRFDAPAEVDLSNGDAFELKNGETQEEVSLIPIVGTEDGNTIVTLRFANGPSTSPVAGVFATLSDGWYQLTIKSERITLGGLSLDGNQDVLPGGDHVFGESPSDKFFSLFGDVDGDADVDTQDLGHMAQSLGTSFIDPMYNEAFDWNSDGFVNSEDYLHLRRRLDRRI